MKAVEIGMICDFLLGSRIADQGMRMYFKLALHANTVDWEMLSFRSQKCGVMQNQFFAFCSVIMKRNAVLFDEIIFLKTASSGTNLYHQTSFYTWPDY